jgi:hypothetical protein
VVEQDTAAQFKAKSDSNSYPMTEAFPVKPFTTGRGSGSSWKLLLKLFTLQSGFKSYPMIQAPPVMKITTGLGLDMSSGK